MEVTVRVPNMASLRTGQSLYQLSYYVAATQGPAGT